MQVPNVNVYLGKASDNLRTEVGSGRVFWGVEEFLDTLLEAKQSFL